MQIGQVQGSSGRAQDSKGRAYRAAPSEICLAGTLVAQYVPYQHILRIFF